MCFEYCSASNKGISFDITNYEDQEHDDACNIVQITNFDRMQYQSSTNETDEFWSLFQKRQYRSSKCFMRWNIAIAALFHCNQSSDDAFDPYNGLDGYLLQNLQALYTKHRNELQQQQIEEFDLFFDCYQYGDGVDCVGMRNVGLYLIGFSCLDNAANGLQLRFLKT